MDVLGRDVKGSGLDVGFVAQGWIPDPGGVETHAALLARELVARGHRAHVLCIDGASERAPYSTDDRREGDVAVRRMAYRYQDHRALADVARNRKAEDVVLAWLAEVPCDVIHVHHLTGFGAGTLRAIADVGQPLVMSLHDWWMPCPRGQMLHVDGEVCEAIDHARCGACVARTWPHLAPSGGGESRGTQGEPLASDADAARARTEFALAMLAHPRRLLAPSGDALERLALLGAPRERLERCEYGFDGRALAEAVARERSARAGGDVRLGVLGALFPSKGVVEIARAFAAAGIEACTLDFHGPAWSYHGDASTVDALRELSARDPRIRLRGEYAPGDLARVLAGLDGVVAPSRFAETFGLAVREARAAGLPVLASSRGALPELARGDRGTTLVASDDPAAWIDALRAFADVARRRELSPASVRSAADMAEQIERVYVDAIVEVTGRRPTLARAATEAPAPPTPARKPGFLRRWLGGGPS